MTEPVFYSYDNECGFDDSNKFDVMKDSAEQALDLVEEFTEDVEIHYGLLIPFAKLVEKDGEFSLEDSTPDDVRESIQELDKRGLNTTANELREKMLAVAKQLDELRKEAEREASDYRNEYTGGKSKAFEESINAIKKALGES